jgi:hypothetical protein
MEFRADPPASHAQPVSQHGSEPAEQRAPQNDPNAASATPADHLEPRSLQWQRNGELASNEVFELVKRLRRVEAAEHRNELWRLSEKP